MRFVCCRAFVMLMVAGMNGGAGWGQSEAEPIGGRGRIFLVDGGFSVGRLEANDQHRTLRWQTDAFLAPFDFSHHAIGYIALDASDDLPPPSGEFALDLRGGGRLFGQLIGISDDAVTLETAVGQRLQIERDAVLSLARAPTEFRRQRPTSLDDPGRRAPWVFEDDGQRLDLERLIAADPPATVVEGNYGVPAELLPDQNVSQWAEGVQRQLGSFVELEMGAAGLLEIDVRWEATPRLNLAFGLNHDHESFERAFRLEVWDGQLVLLRDLGETLSLTPVRAGSDLNTDREWRLLVEFDQSEGRVTIYDQSLNQLAELVAPAKQGDFGSGVRLRSDAGTQVTRLIATSGRGLMAGVTTPPRTTPAIVLSDGDVREGVEIHLDELDESFKVRDAENEWIISRDQVQRLIFANPRGLELGLVDGTNRGLYRAVTRDGWFVHGAWDGVQSGELRLKVSGVPEPVQIPLSRLESLSAVRPTQQLAEHDLDHDRKADALDGARREARLIAEEVNLRGRIVESEPRDQFGTLHWQPVGSENGAPLRGGVEARIDFQARSSPWTQNQESPQPGQAPQPGILGGALLQLFGGNPQANRGGRPVTRAAATVRRGVTASKGVMFLRSGDTVPGQVISIDEQGVRFKSSSSDVSLVAHQQIKSVILSGLDRPKQISATTRDRLLMVPRSRRDDPPTHLLCSRTGDFLRGRLVAMDEKFVTVEVRLETRRIARDRIAQIFWMHPEELLAESSETSYTANEQSSAVQPEPPSQDKLRVQARRMDGTRISFDYQSCRDGQILVGHNPVLGECQVDLRELDQLLLGMRGGRALEGSPLADWQPFHAPIPKAFLPRDGDGEGGTSGTESALVGKPAPAFELELLGGDKFRLEDHRGRVVVLDFWASWCGPCIQAMPLIEQVVAEFPAEKVQLIGVNLQEQPETITATLERMELELTVALDQYGAVAEQYGVTAIPQTVIVGANGNVARLYVGIHSSMADELRRAIGELLQKN